MSWTTPVTRATGYVVLATDWNAEHVGDLTYLAGYKTTTKVDPTNTVAETDLLNSAITIAAGILGTTGLIRLTAFGDYKQTSGGSVATPRLKLKLGGTTLIDTNAPAASSASSATRFPWAVVATIANLGAANSQWTSFKLDIAGSIAATFSAAAVTGEGLYWGNSTSNIAAAVMGNSSAIDTTAGCALVLSVIQGTATSSDFACLGARVELL